MQEANSAEYAAHKATELAPSWESPYSALGAMYTDLPLLKNLDKAKHFFELADKVDSSAFSTNIWHIDNWATFYNDYNQGQEAEKQYKKILRIDSNLTQVHNDLGNVFMKMRRFNLAKKQFQKAIESNL